MKGKCQMSLCLGHDEAVKGVSDSSKGLGHKMKALGSSWGGGEMQSAVPGPAAPELLSVVRHSS